ncbi:antibiotic biosynthesis monooxygenase [Jatrophihabitans endophyticus]|uniref:antibiotic biosynthesis monooxygenase n=1 Tax=Jatrophihabitans endophyticus TaxID=1206085 RepID=UPI0019F3A528|nr:antibiotic biosynthesis monooxygenase [Jatrophihabitans endophyticus]MBE7188877.1 antibiotic biosynthesis monooxygenase [Jatrophihabitans endophyticus]
MIALTHFRADEPDFEARAATALAALAARPGYLRGSLGRSTDDEAAWVLLTEWENVGSYRRALGNYDVKLQATPLLAGALDLPSGFETLLDVAPGGAVLAQASDRTPDG